ncbi:hypothetical protein [Brevundimonas faecalis]|uniref:Uncharacterized protein n=1 Tax=Brevundimonas faecalis TaxID=947378 RepID=A0ABV2R7I2_9CAUL
MGYAALAVWAAIQLSATPADQGMARQLDDELGRIAAASSQCHQLGYSVSPFFSEAIEAELSEPKLNSPSPAVREQWVLESMRAHVAEFARLGQAASDGATARERTAEPTHRMVEWLDRACAAATSHIVTRDYITAPANFDRAASRRMMADDILQGAGLASWQTPAIFARGDVFMLLGACSDILPEARLSALSSATMPSADVRTSRERQFYERKYREGVESINQFNFSATQCESRYRTLNAKVPGAGRGRR